MVSKIIMLIVGIFFISALSNSKKSEKLIDEIGCPLRNVDGIEGMFSIF